MILGTRLSGPRLLGKVVFLQDDRLLDAYAQWALSWWRGERTSRGVIGGLTRRCRYVLNGPDMGIGLSSCCMLKTSPRICRFRDGCEWLLDEGLNWEEW